ncbi:MAG: TIGR04255 family protein [Acidimicrobiia bacterium]
MLADSHEVYPNAPLAFVTVEVRFPGETSQGVAGVVQRAFREVLGDEWVIEQLTQQEVTFGINLGGPPAQSVRAVNIPRFTVRDRTSAVVLTSNSVTIQTTRYPGWPDFRTVLERVLHATRDLAEPDGVARVGMRFVDEIRVPEVGENVDQWAPWLSSEILAPAMTAMSKAGCSPVTWTGVAQFGLGDAKQLVLRYGPQNGYAVSPIGPLRRLNPPAPGPLFLLDFDSFWEPASIPLFDVDALLSVCDTLRAPTRSLFDLLVTEKLVNEVFRKES